MALNEVDVKKYMRAEMGDKKRHGNALKNKRRGGVPHFKLVLYYIFMSSSVFGFRGYSWCCLSRFPCHYH